MESNFFKKERDRTPNDITNKMGIVPFAQDQPFLRWTFGVCHMASTFLPHPRTTTTTVCSLQAAFSCQASLFHATPCAHLPLFLFPHLLESVGHLLQFFRPSKPTTSFIAANGFWLGITLSTPSEPSTCQDTSSRHCCSKFRIYFSTVTVQSKNLFRSSSCQPARRPKVTNDSSCASSYRQC